VSDVGYELVISPTARRQLAEVLPESVAFAAYEFIIGPLLANPHRVGKRLQPPLSDRHRNVPGDLSDRRPDARRDAGCRRSARGRVPGLTIRV
jgi:hypothetical protein